MMTIQKENRDHTNYIYDAVQVTLQKQTKYQNIYNTLKKLKLKHRKQIKK